MAVFPGTPGPDSYPGTADNDTIFDGGGGNDTLNGAGGEDVITVTGGLDSTNGGDGDDLLVVDYSAIAGAFTSVNLGGGVGRLTNSSTASVDFREFERFNIITGAGADVINLTIASGVGGGSDTVRSGAGDDVINTGAGAAVIDGGAGFDEWRADYSAVTASGYLDLSLAGTQSFLGGSVTGIEAVSLTLGAGNDTILTLTGAAGMNRAETLNGGDGNDVIGVGSGADVANGGLGDDLLIVDYSAIAGTFVSVNLGGGVGRLTNSSTASIDYREFERFDISTGAGADVINLTIAAGTGGGADTVRSGGGDDTISTGAGVAVVDGGAGRDSWQADLSFATAGGYLDLSSATTQAFLGGSVTGVEAVRLVLGSGADTVLTLTGVAGQGLSDSVDGGAGDDVVGVGGGADTADGGDGDDLLIVDYSAVAGAFASVNLGGGTARLTNSSTASVDYREFERFDVTTGAGNDTINLTTAGMGGGDDTVNAGTGTDNVNTGAGFDRLVVDYSAATVGIVSNFSGTLAAGFSGSYAAGAQFTVSFAGVESFDIRGGSGADNIATGGAADTLQGGGGADTLNGGGGDDLIEGGVGNDTLVGGDGNDTVSYASSVSGVGVSLEAVGNQNTLGAGIDNLSGFENLRGSGFADTLSGDGAGNRIEGLGGGDSLFGFGGNDTLIGGEGGDTLTGGAGADLMFGDAGAEIFRIGIGDSTLAESDVIRDFVSGEDRLMLTDLNPVAAALVLIQQSAAGSVVLVDADADGAFETRILLSDSITAGDVSVQVGVSVVGDATNQVLRGTTRTDALAGGGGDDQIAGAAGNDSLYGQDGNDLIYGQDGGDFAYGGAGADAILGGEGDDALLGEEGADSLFGEAGVDLLYGGGGNDGLYGGIGNDTQLGGDGNDAVVGEDGNDTLFGEAGADTLSGGEGLDTLFGGVGADQLIGGLGDDVLLGEADGDLLFGQEGADQLFGGGGVDPRFGGADGDSLFGGDGADTLAGEDGGDVLVGGLGGDVLVGGGGGDLFLFQSASDSTNAAADLIADFTAGQDVIDVSQVDANAGAAGDQAFVWVTGAFTAAGQARLTYVAAQNRTFFEADVNGDGVADLAFSITGQVGQGDGFVL